MCGLGYMHPEWGHGMYQGDNQSMYDSYDLSEDPHDPPFCTSKQFQILPSQCMAKLLKAQEY